MTGGEELEKYVARVVKRGDSLYVKVDTKVNKGELKEGDFVIVDLKKVEM